MISLFLLMAAAPARGAEFSKPVEVAPLAGVALPALPQPLALPFAPAQLPGAIAAASLAPQAAASQGAAPQASAPGAAAERARTESDRFWEGGGASEPAPAYWKTAFDENARIVETRERFSAVRGLISVSHFSTRNHQGVATPGLQLVLESKADMATVLADMARVEPALKNYRLIQSQTPGERPVVYLVRPARTGTYRDPLESAALAQERREDARFSDTLHLASGSDAPVDAGRLEKALVRDYIEKPEVFSSRAEALRYIVLDEKPEGMLSDPESLPQYLARAISKAGSRRFWSGVLGDGLIQVGFYQQRRPLVVALSPEAPEGLPQPVSVYGLKTELKAYQVKEGKPRRFASLREPMRWLSGWAGLAVTGALGLGLLPAAIAGLAWMYHVSPGMFFLGFVLALFIGPYLALAFRDSLSWTIRMARLYRAIPKA